MKRILIPLILGMTLVYSACCTKKMCLSAYSFQLHGFDTADLSGAYIVTQNDTSAMEWRFSQDSSFIMISEININQKAAILCMLPTADRSFVLSNFRYKKQKCNDCFLAKDQYEVFTGCDVNGQPQDGTTIKLFK